MRNFAGLSGIGIWIAILLLAACGDEAGKGTLNIKLTDAPAAFEAVNVTFSEIRVHKSGSSDDDGTAGWITVSDQAETVNLLQWANGNTFPLVSTELEAGKYTQIRLLLTSSSVTTGGQTYPMDIHSSMQSGLKLNHPFTIAEGIGYDLIIDFDADRSVKKTGNGQFRMNPVIRLIAEANSGAISGTVNDVSALPTAYAIVGLDTITSTPVDIATAAFKLGFLPPDTYSVSVTDTQDRTGSVDNIDVSAGDDVDVGEIALQ